MSAAYSVLRCGAAQYNESYIAQTRRACNLLATANASVVFTCESILDGASRLAGVQAVHLQSAGRLYALWKDAIDRDRGTGGNVVTFLTTDEAHALWRDDAAVGGVVDASALRWHKRRLMLDFKYLESRGLLTPFVCVATSAGYGRALL